MKVTYLKKKGFLPLTCPRSFQGIVVLRSAFIFCLLDIEYVLNVLLIVLMVLSVLFFPLISIISDSQLHIFGEREETVKLLKEFLWCNLCITFGHTYVRMSEHLAHRFNRNALLQCDKCGKGMPCSVRCKWKRNACP